MNIFNYIKASLWVSLLFTCSTIPSLALATDLQARQNDLKKLQLQINQQQSELKITSKQREKLLSLLRQDEHAIAAAAKKINDTKQTLIKTDKRLSELKQRQTELNKQKTSQQQTLSNQLTSAYLAGNHDYSKMLLNQQSPASIERLLAYYQYLNNARIKSINELVTTIKELESVKKEQIIEKQQLNKLIINQQQQAKQLDAEQAQRQLTLNQLQKSLSSKGAKLEQLQIEEASLKQIVEQAILAMKNSPSMDGLSRSKKLKWPAKGKIRSGFGSQRSGQVKWKGVMLTAQEGSNISSIAAGKVIYADWLKGVGMVLVIDHGKGYMSLYGHAQTLLKRAGELVKQGETIALVGRSGGQTRAGLYFEIRHKGQAIDPARYCKR